jgi:hypothetical protein
MNDTLPTTDASPTGIAECLGMLADEAASLRLVRTFLALLETLEICRAEASAAAAPVSVLPKAAEPVDPAAVIVH